MKKLFICFLLITSFVNAQDKMLTTQDCVYGWYSGLYPSHLKQLMWIKGTENYCYVQTSNGNEILNQVIPNGKSSKIIDLLALKELMVKNNFPSIKNFPSIEWISSTTFRFYNEHMYFIYNSKSKSLTGYKDPITDETSESVEESSSGNIAYTIANNLYVMNKGDGYTWATQQVTDDRDINIVNGKSVHRDEFGISKGTFWSPNGGLLAFYRMDQTMVTDYPVYDLTKQPATVNMIKYPMAGQTSHQVTIGVYNVETKSVVFLKTGEPKDQYLTNIAWSPDEQHIYVQVLNRDQNHLWLNVYSAITGAFEKTLFEETSDKYVHPMHPIQFVPGHDNQFIFQSQTISSSNPEGLNHLYLYETSGRLITDLLPTVDIPAMKMRIGAEVTETYGFDKEGKYFYFQAAPLNSCERHVYAVEIKMGGQIKKLTSVTGMHNGLFCEDKKYFIDMFSSPSVPGTDYLCESSNGKQDRTINTSDNPLSSYRNCAVRLFSITAADGKTPLWCRMILPANFDSTKHYKSLTYVYNGPGVQLVTNSWLAGADLFLYYMAQQGFVVFTIDGRGSSNRGLAFEQATFRHLGTEEVADQSRGNDYLRSLNYIDQNRMAVYGWSFGGFMTTSLMTRTPGLYKCGVAGGPVIDWSYYEVMYTERYMDTPQTNPDGYKESDLKRYVANLKGKLLQIHGTSDDVVVWQHSLLYQKACVDKNVQCDYYVYPGHLHNVRGKDRVNLYDKISQYIMTNLGT